MGQIFGGITDFLGLTDYAGERQAARNAATANAQAYALSKESIDLAKEEFAFQKDQYTDWKSIYGDLQTNLGEYYKNLTPEKITSLGLENQQREFQQVDTAIRRDLAQKGLSDSGIEAAVTSDVAFKNASARAAIRSTAEQTAAERKLGFLGIGLGQGTQMLGLIGNAAANTTNAFSTAVGSRTTAAGQYLNQQTQIGSQNRDTVGTFVGSMGVKSGYLA